MTCGKVIEETVSKGVCSGGVFVLTCQSHSPILACRKIVEETVSKWGRIDVLVNNAAFQGKLVEKFEDIDRSRLERTFHTNILVRPPSSTQHPSLPQQFTAY